MSATPRSEQPPKHPSTITRFYIDTRPLVNASPKSLPLLSTLQFSEQESITRFIRPADRFMSLGSALLKYTFIHRQAGIPWPDIRISRTPAPHKRPYWEPPELWTRSPISASQTAPTDNRSDSIQPETKGLEFNVSHQAGLVAILGCTTPTSQLPNPSTSISQVTPLSPTLPAGRFEQLSLTGHHTPILGAGQVRLGVDIACTNEDKRTPKDVTTQAKFDEWVDIFSEMFSDRERRDMRFAPVHVPVSEREEGDYYGWESSDDSSASASAGHTGGNREAKMIEQKLRRFYAYWALKEAYIKMVGEGLLASWLRELEFLDVVPPAIPEAVLKTRRKERGRSRGGGVSEPNAQAGNHSHLHPDALQHEADKWTTPEKAERGMTTLFRAAKVEDVDIELVAYDEDFLIATATRGLREETDGPEGRRWIRLDIERDIRPCAEGRCSCVI
ncbi:uncharacterized protein PV06_06758 [Exophiala oligosperma]|uniref:holo-[acyl-carrier-protein] synthase n=1 Tax=Exophiala oligosperma TaxID=215243 RepID=A0A0D2AMK1_9EURO|nr:uncharacterized protein PV06_06758 [Exophiala oligosperma]KIW41176.1 hypothetical protein PV06_06758 [Exophiala oligosperma]